MITETITPKAQKSTDSMAQGTVVIVDDNPNNLLTLKALLESAHYNVFAAISGQLALNAIDDVQPDLILLDVMMPDMNGYEVCRRLKAKDSTKDIPVLFISALDEEMDKVKAFETGGVDYISKPFQSEEVLARVRTHVSLARSKKELEAAYENLMHHTRELEIRNSDLKAFSYSVSHDLKAPLRHIDAYSKILLDDYGNKLDDDAQHYLDRMRAGVLHMRHLIDDILALFRVSQSNVELGQVNLSSIAHKVVDNLMAAHDSQAPMIRIEEGLSETCDSGLMKIALTNLFDNAWKYTSRTENPRIEFGMLNKPGEKTFYIRDNGVGFDMQYASKLFQPFQRMHADKEYEGTGIGLATVYRIIQHHGGNIWVETKKDQGATFYFTLVPGNAFS